MFSLFRKQRPKFEDTRFLVIDMELTGLDAKEHSILSTGTVQIINGRLSLATAEHRYFSASALMGDDVTDSAHIHMITDQQREEHGQSLALWLDEICKAEDIDAWVFHHAPIDMSFIKLNCERQGFKLPKIRIVDTLMIERKLHAGKHLESQAQLNLNTCRARYGLPVYRQHHALSDALATAELMLAQEVKIQY